MTEVHDPPRGGKGGDPSYALLCLSHFIDAAVALDAAWHPLLDCPTYPRYLPSFDEFVTHLLGWRDEAEDRPYTEPEETKPPNVTDPAVLRVWLAELRTQVADITAAGEDATRPHGRRVLGRRTARSSLLAARRAIEQLLDAADRGVAIASHA